MHCTSASAQTIPWLESSPKQVSSPLFGQVARFCPPCGKNNKQPLPERAIAADCQNTRRLSLQLTTLTFLSVKKVFGGTLLFLTLPLNTRPFYVIESEAHVKRSRTVSSSFAVEAASERRLRISCSLSAILRLGRLLGILAFSRWGSCLYVLSSSVHLQ